MGRLTLKKHISCSLSGCHPNWYVYAVLLEERSGYYSWVVTDIDGHMHRHTNKHGKWTAKEGRRKNSILVTVYSCHNYSPPLPHRHTHPHSPTRQMHLPAKIRPDRENTFPEISVTYICEQTRSEAHTHTQTHTNWCHVSHHWFSLFSFLAGLPVYFSSLSSRSQRCSSEQWKPTGLVVLSFLYSISVFRTSRHNIIICMYVFYFVCITIYFCANDIIFCVETGSSPRLDLY